MDNVEISNQEQNSADIGRQLVADLKVALSDIDALVRATANQRGAGISKVRAKTADSVAAIKTRIADAELALVNKGKQTSKIAVDYVRENPWRNLGVVAGVGLLIGLLMGRR